MRLDKRKFCAVLTAFSQSEFRACLHEPTFHLPRNGNTNTIECRRQGKEWNMQRLSTTTDGAPSVSRHRNMSRRRSTGRCSASVASVGRKRMRGGQWHGQRSEHGRNSRFQRRETGQKSNSCAMRRRRGPWHFPGCFSVSQLRFP